jgi:transcriptional regulator with XRE-family HTH domain
VQEQGITQMQMAELLEVSQQTINAYEVGRRRRPLSSLPVIARYLGVSIEELLGERPSAAAKKHDPQEPAAGGAHPAATQGQAALRHADDRYRARSAGPLKGEIGHGQIEAHSPGVGRADHTVDPGVPLT